MFFLAFKMLNDSESIVLAILTVILASSSKSHSGLISPSSIKGLPGSETLSKLKFQFSRIDFENCKFQCVGLEQPFV